MTEMPQRNRTGEKDDVIDIRVLRGLKFFVRSRPAPAGI